MAEERNLATARPTDATDEDATKADLQRRMEAARESISQTVEEIKDTVVNQYEHIKETVSEQLDWREQFRKRPVAWSVGALSVGFAVGYGVAGTFKGNGADDDEGAFEDGEGVSASGRSSRAVQSIKGSAYAPSAGYAPAPSSAQSAASSEPDSRPSYSSGYEAGTAEEEPDKPSLLARFKETRAYDRLQEEVSNLGDHLLDELSKVGQSVILPALLGKVKEMFGVDLSNKQQSDAGARRVGTPQAGSTGAAATGNAPAAQQGAQAASASAGTNAGGGATSNPTGGSSYGTSPNQSYNAQASDRDDYGRSTGSTSKANG